MNLFKELFLSVFSWKSYEKFLKDKNSKVFLFGLLLSFFYFAIVILVPFMKLQVVDGGVTGLLWKYIPDYNLKDGRLWVEREIYYVFGSTYVEINTSPDYRLPDADQVEPFLLGYSNALVADSEKAIVKSEGVMQELYFDEIPEVSLSRTDLLKYLPYAYLCIVIIFAAVFLIMGAGIFLGALIVALIGMIVASCMKCQLTFGQLYVLAIHARTPALLLKAVLTFLPFTVPFFLFINFGISVCYLAGAICKMKEQKLKAPLEFTT